MTKLLTASLSSKGQLTLPKEVRAALGVGLKGESVGFLVDEQAGVVRLARVESVLVDPEFTEEELRKIEKLRGAKNRRGFKTAEGLLRDLKTRP